MDESDNICCTTWKSNWLQHVGCYCDFWDRVVVGILHSHHDDDSFHRDNDTDGPWNCRDWVWISIVRTRKHGRSTRLVDRWAFLDPNQSSNQWLREIQPTEATARWNFVERLFVPLKSHLHLEAVQLLTPDAFNHSPICGNDRHLILVHGFLY